MAISNPRARRIDVRVSDEQNALIREAAALSGQTVTAFLLDAAQDRARALMDERRHLVMSQHAFARFAEALDAPAEPVAEMSELFRLPRIDAA
ncbi:MAG TPA: DUF1778 domain-containing protein [Conexibacter sp.]|nr:DUF1778 domain-containing protein [Conexibacter sp.]